MTDGMHVNVIDIASRNKFLECLPGIRAGVKDSSLKLDLIKFDGNNFNMWEYQMKQYLSTVGYWGIVSGIIKKPIWPLAVRTANELANYTPFERGIINATKLMINNTMTTNPPLTPQQVVSELELLEQH